MWQRVGTALFWLAWPLSTILIRFTSRTRVLLRVGDEVLLTRTWLSDGRWSLPGGGLHRGEAPEAGVLRELHEETGLVVPPPALQSLGNSMYRANGQRFRCYYFTAELSGKPVLRLRPLEMNGSRWVRLQDLPDASCGPDAAWAVHALRAIL